MKLLPIKDRDIKICIPSVFKTTRLPIEDTWVIRLTKGSSAYCGGYFLGFGLPEPSGRLYEAIILNHFKKRSLQRDVTS